MIPEEEADRLAEEINKKLNEEPVPCHTSTSQALHSLTDSAKFDKAIDQMKEVVRAQLEANPQMPVQVPNRRQRRAMLANAKKAGRVKGRSVKRSR